MEVFLLIIWDEGSIKYHQLEIKNSKKNICRIFPFRNKRVFEM